MKSVLDASAAIEIFLNGADAPRFKEALAESDLILAPDTFPSEITNVFWKYAYFADFGVSKAEAGIRHCLELVDDFVDTKLMCAEVFQAAIESKHSVYDIFYLVLARRSAGTLLSKDKRLVEIADRLGVRHS